MGKKFEMRVILFENGALGIATKSNGANGADAILVLSKIVNDTIENLHLDASEQYYFLRDLVSSVLNMREEEDRI